MKLALNFAAAFALGAFLALLIALSTSPVVAPTVATLLTAALLFLTLSDKLPGSGSAALSEEVLARILSFSVGAIIALGIGLYVRTTSVNEANSLGRIYADLIAINMPDANARTTALEIYKSRLTGASQTERQTGSMVLFGNEVNNSTCSELDPKKFADAASLEAKFSLYGGIWSEALDYAKAVDLNASSTDYKSFLTGYYALACQPIKPNNS